MPDLNSLIPQAGQNTNPEQSTAQFLQSVAAEIEKVKNDPAAVSALSQQLRDNASKLAGGLTSRSQQAGQGNPQANR